MTDSRLSPAMQRMLANRREAWGKSSRLTPGATQSPVNPGFGQTMTGRPRNPGNIPNNTPGDGPYPSYNSTYASRTDQPTIIEDVDLGNFYSPFQPIIPFGRPGTPPREWDYMTGENLRFIDPRMELYKRLRLMRRGWGVLATIIETRKDQLLKMPWQIQLRNNPRGTSKAVDKLREFYRLPDGKLTFNQWARKLLDDLFVIDAPTLHVGYRNMAGEPLIVEVFDGATIKPLIDDAGRRPDAPSPAFQQIIKGLPMDNFDETEILYMPMRAQPEYPIWGYSPVEQIFIEITEAIKKTMYQLGFWTEGNLPDMIMSVPKEWNPRQIAGFQALFDAQLSGNLGQKSKVRFVPDGMKPYDIKGSAGENLTSNRDELLIRLACYAFSVSPTPFIKGMNRATAQVAQDESTIEGLHPLMAWFKDDVMDRLITVEHGVDEAHFVWLPAPEADQLKRSQIFMNKVKSGLITINEARQQDGQLPVEGGDEILIYTNNGVMTLADAIRQGAAVADLSEVNANAPQQSAGGAGNPTGPSGGGVSPTASARSNVGVTHDPTSIPGGGAGEGE